MLGLVSLEIFIQKKYFFVVASVKSELTGAWLHWFTLSNKEQLFSLSKGLACKVFDTFATHHGLVYDITDTDCMLGSKWQH